jgi:alkaline phosphatase
MFNLKNKVDKTLGLFLRITWKPFCESKRLFYINTKIMFKLNAFSIYLLCILCGCSSTIEPDMGISSQLLHYENNLGQGQTYVTNDRPRKVILLIGDGMGLSQITAGSIVKKIPLALERCRQVGLVKTYSTKLITDSAASATAMATGQKNL